METLTRPIDLSSESTCAICESRRVKPSFEGLVKCRQCGFVWMDKKISPEELKLIYSDNYFFSGEYEDYLAEERALMDDFTKQFDSLKPYIKGGRLLEIGSAYGFFLNLARPHFDDAIGVEINEKACEYSKKRFGLDVRNGDFLDVDLPLESFDMVVCWATFEHLNAPQEYVKKIRSLLKPGGVFALTTVDIESVIARIRGKRWRQIHPPTHFSYFPRRTLLQLLNKHGFDVMRQWYIGATRSISHALYSILVVNYKKPKIFNFLKSIGLTKGYVRINTYDAIYCIAVKK